MASSATGHRSSTTTSIPESLTGANAPRSPDPTPDVEIVASRPRSLQHAVHVMDDRVKDRFGRAVALQIACRPIQKHATSPVVLTFTYVGVPASVDMRTLEAPPVPDDFTGKMTSCPTPGGGKSWLFAFKPSSNGGSMTRDQRRTAILLAWRAAWTEGEAATYDRDL